MIDIGTDISVPMEMIGIVAKIGTISKGLDKPPIQSYHTYNEKTPHARRLPFVRSNFLTTVNPTLTHGVHGNSGHERSGEGLKIIRTH